MRQIVVIFALAFTLFATSACNNEKADNQNETAGNEQATNDAQPSEEPQAFDFESADAQFMATFPGKPDMSEEAVRQGDIDILKYTVSYAPDPTKNYTVVVSQFPEDQFKGKDPQEVLEGVMNGIMRNTGGRLAEQSDLPDAEYPAIAFKLKTGNMNFVYHVYLYKHILYQVSQSAMNKFPEDLSFMESFEVME